jgi:hypothetical protein
MEPQQEPGQPKQQPTPPVVQPPEPSLVQTPLNTPEETVQTPFQELPKKSHKKLLGLLLLIGPSALLLLSILLYSVANLMANSQPTGTDQLFPEPTPLLVVANIFLFIVGGISVITWLPGIIIGIILLNKK